ncbi:hypothetical protein D7V86_25165 [bacterium D16-51]|nr:hypothetical protein D7V96_25805 [bacterium D16-59]RKI53337.1 hypothetical protein D7V86_25165 [bacterium D16-51]
MAAKSRALLVFADVQQDTPQYLCMDGKGFYLCTVGQRDGNFVEQAVQRVDAEQARVFMANAFNRAMEITGYKAGYQKAKMYPDTL